MRSSCLLLLAALLPGCASVPARDAVPDPFPPASAPAVRRERPRPPERGVRTSRLSGRVLSREGRAEPGARVSVLRRAGLWDPAGGVPLAVSETDAQGRFEVERLEPGEYTVTALTAAGQAVFGSPLEVRAGTWLAAMTLSVEDTPLGVEGVVLGEGGEPVRGAEVWLYRTGSLEEPVPLGRTEDGRFRVSAPRGAYVLGARAEGFFPEWRQVVPLEGRHAVEVRLTRPVGEEGRRAALDWMKKQGALPVRSGVAGQGFEDLAPLERTLADVRVVALGESTPGTREFFQLKHRLVEFLVERLGYGTVALEAGFAETRVLDEYVLTGRGEPLRVLQGLYDWRWNTEEMLALVEWARRYNEDPAHVRKVRFAGFDPRFSRGAVVAVVDYLSRVEEAGYVRELDARLAPLESLDSPSVAQRADLKAALEEVAARLEARRADFEGELGAEAWGLTRHQVTLLLQYLEVEERGARRLDAAMAENVQWILQREGPEAKVVVWASNARVSRDEDARVGPRMGNHLARALGKGLYVFGLTFGQGSFQTLNDAREPQESRRGLVGFSLPPAPEQSLEGTLARVGPQVFAVDVRAVPGSESETRWWRQPQWTREIGPRFAGEGESSFRPVRVGDAYDGLLFVGRTTRARPAPEPPVLP